MKSKILEFLKGWASVIVICPEGESIRNRLAEMRNRNPTEVDHNNIKKDFQKAQGGVNEKK